jgi:hypothetical protein
MVALRLKRVKRGNPGATRWSLEGRVLLRISCGFGGFGELHAPFFTERCTRGSLQRIVAGNPVREMAKKCVVSVVIRLLLRFFGFGGLFFRSALYIRDRWRVGGRSGKWLKSAW